MEKIKITLKKLDWSDDHLGRQTDAANIIQLIDNRAARMAKRGQKGAVVLNLDARWGEGKTFLLDRMQAQLQNDGRLVAAVNAWELDYDDDPFPALIGPIAKALASASPEDAVTKSTEDKPAWKKLAKVAAPIGFAALKGGVKQGMKLAFGGEAASSILEIGQSALEGGTDATLESVETAGRSLLADEQTRRDAIAAFKEEIKEQLASLPEVKNASPIKLIILVDELDRCRPHYAISMLERIKHLFDIEGVAFVIATDTKQLCASIKGVYGTEFDAQTYLRRFFALSYRLPLPSMAQLIENTFSRNKYDRKKLFGRHSDQAVEIVAGIFAAFECSTRDAIQHLAHADMAVDGFEKDRIYYPLILIECICQQSLKKTTKQIYSTGNPEKAASLKIGVAFIQTNSNTGFNEQNSPPMDAVNYVAMLMGASISSKSDLMKVNHNNDFFDWIYHDTRRMLFGDVSYSNCGPVRVDLEGIVSACGKPVELA